MLNKTAKSYSSTQGSMTSLPYSSPNIEPRYELPNKNLKPGQKLSLIRNKLVSPNP